MSTCAGNDLEVTTGSTPETLALGKKLGRLLSAGDVVALSGPLGAGKTYLTKGIALGLGLADSRAVRSPTFVLVSELEGRLKLYHVDAYRLSSAAEFTALGSDEFLFSDGVTVVEWAERVAAALPREHLWVDCRHAGETRRTFRFSGHGERWREVVGKLAEAP
jgi:tRNA threonylcarbamoyladenosine biosynthesis protein TsaE